MIAQGMRKQLTPVETGYVNRVLFGGLVLVLERRGVQWRLAIGRETAPPGKRETEVVATAFGVPPGVEWSWSFKPKKRTKGHWQVAECSWIDRETCHENNCDSEQQGRLRQNRNDLLPGQAAGGDGDLDAVG
jgi:hypothetical protein